MNYRIVSNGIKFKIQKKSTTLFLRRECWKDLGKPIPGCTLVWPTYYDTLSEARLGFDRFVERDSKLTEWTEVKL